MEFWIKNDNIAVRFPINPPDFDATYSNSVSTINIVNAGDLNIYGNRKLGIYKLDLLLPAIGNNYGFAYPSTIGSDDPYKYISIFWELKRDKTAFQYIVTGTPINWTCIIEDFTMRQDDGTGDLRVSLNLRQYWEPKLKLASESNVADNKPRESTVSTTVYGSNTSSSSGTLRPTIPSTNSTNKPNIPTTSPQPKPPAQSGGGGSSANQGAF